MSDSSTLLVRQRLDKFEACTGCVKRNKYKIAALADPSNPDFTDKFEESSFKALPQVFTAKEESSFLCRICCQKWREFKMTVTAEKPGEDPVAYTFERPFKCTMLCCCVMLFPQELTVKDHAAANMGRVWWDFNCLAAMCGKLHWKVDDAGGNTQYVVEDNTCCNKNMCAPTPCCPTRTMDILDPASMQPVGSIQNIFPGCSFKNIFRICSQTDSYKLTFPKDATPQNKALLLGSLMLLEYVYFEKSSEDS